MDKKFLQYVESSILHKDLTHTKNFICEYVCDDDGHCKIDKSCMINMLHDKNVEKYLSIMDTLERNSDKFHMRNIKGYVITNKKYSGPNIFIKNKNNVSNNYIFMINKDEIKYQNIDLDNRCLLL
jgi:hypothetical protein